MACSSLFAQSLPNGSQGFQILVYIFGTDNDFGSLFQCRNVIELRQAETVGMLVGQYEELVMGTIPDGACQAAFQFLAKDYFLFTHLINYKL